MLLQELWSLELDWHESLPQNLHSTWISYRNQLTRLNQLSIPRWILCTNPISVQVHGFCDASEKAYGAAIYLRSISTCGEIHVNLLCAKSKVAPLKQTTLPRLELCGALLLAQLYNKVITSLDMKIEKSLFWCDSTITLAWINAPSKKWKTYVANRVSEIKQLPENHGTWNHVVSPDKPADLISGGINPDELADASLWWHGPSWLSQSADHWQSTSSIHMEEIPEERECKQISLSNHATTIDENLKNFDRFSSFSKLVRVLSYCFRFWKKLGRPLTSSLTGSLTLQEMENSKYRIINLIQTESFRSEIHCLRNNIKLASNNKLKSFTPFLDSEGFFRVGGRLINAPIPFDQKHPFVLPSNHKLTHLIVADEHRRLLHAGCQAVVASLRTRYWPLNCKGIVKEILRQCVRCFRANPVGTGYIMGNLPAARVTPSRPFSTTGVDYAGPYYVKDRTRSKTVTKAYLCIFVCFVTKAVHLELATDLTTNEFLSCLKRLTSRRGLCQTIYSDNGTNFVGAKNELSELTDLLLNFGYHDSVTNFALENGIKWIFIPSHAPHFGGLWESTVKSAKYHLKRVIGETRLTFPDLYTTVTQVEACLNSRPLSPLSDAPSDFNPLTPGHFLTGDSLLAIPEPDLRQISVTRLDRYQNRQQMIQHFWQRWQQEYLH